MNRCLILLLAIALPASQVSCANWKRNRANKKIQKNSRIFGDQERKHIKGFGRGEKRDYVWDMILED